MERPTRWSGGPVTWLRANSLVLTACLTYPDLPKEPQARELNSELSPSLLGHILEDPSGALLSNESYPKRLITHLSFGGHLIWKISTLVPDISVKNWKQNKTLPHLTIHINVIIIINPQLNSVRTYVQFTKVWSDPFHFLKVFYWVTFWFQILFYYLRYSILKHVTT